MIRRQPDIFVEVEGCHPGEIQALVAMHANELLVEPLGRATRGEAKHRVGLVAHDTGDDPGAEQTTSFGIFSNKDFHGLASERTAEAGKGQGRKRSPAASASSFSPP